MKVKNIRLEIAMIYRSILYIKNEYKLNEIYCRIQVLLLTVTLFAASLAMPLEEQAQDNVAPSKSFDEIISNILCIN
jgi:hypothetical protein